MGIYLPIGSTLYASYPGISFIIDWSVITSIYTRNDWSLITCKDIAHSSQHSQATIHVAQ